MNWLEIPAEILSKLIRSLANHCNCSGSPEILLELGRRILANSIRPPVRSYFTMTSGQSNQTFPVGHKGHSHGSVLFHGSELYILQINVYIFLSPIVNIVSRRCFFFPQWGKVFTGDVEASFARLPAGTVAEIVTRAQY